MGASHEPGRLSVKQERMEWGRYFSASALGVEVGVALALGMGIGWGLDKLFHTQPWLLVIFTGFGIIAGFRNLILTSRDKLRAAEGDGKSSRPGKERT